MSAVNAGRRGPDVRSDLWVELELRESGGIVLDIKSKVNFMYGETNRQLAQYTLKTLGVQHARVDIEDTGALPFVIMARLETAVRRALSEVQSPKSRVSPCLPGPGPTFALPSARDRWRRSRLYLPGNEPRFMLNARIHRPDAVILDLEDSVPAPDKDAALLVVRNALYALDFGDCERMVRINPLPAGLDEIEPLVHAGVNVILIPKCESAEQVKSVDARISSVHPPFASRLSPLETYLMPIVETCEGVSKAREIAGASPRIVALTYGLEDYPSTSAASRPRPGLRASGRVPRSRMRPRLPVFRQSTRSLPTSTTWPHCRPVARPEGNSGSRAKAASTHARCRS